jgi:amidase
MDLLYASATQQAKAVREKKISSEELIRACIRRIEDVNPRINAVVQLPAEQALAEARAADEALTQGQILGPLHGVPFTLKDAIETAGVTCTGGTQGRAYFVPRNDAVVAKRLKAAGAIFLGKTNCPEMGWAWEADNLVYGRTNNPWNLDLSPGGSSGGESAIIAAGGSPLGLGSDAGGSVRFPAHCTGIAGIKPTSGRVPRTGHFPGPGGTLDAFWQIGPLARRVEDLTLALKVIASADWADFSVVPMPLGDPGAVDRKSLRLAFYLGNGISAPEPEIILMMTRLVKELTAAGLAVEEGRPPRIEQTYEIYLGLFSADGGEGLHQLLKQAGTVHPHPLMKQVLEIQSANRKSLSEYIALTGKWDALRYAMWGFMERYDAIVCPVCSLVAMQHGSTYQRLPSFSYTMTYNLTGWPAAVVRAGTSAEGLPIGVQIVARPWREDVALAVAQTIEEISGGWKLPPL